MPPEAPFFSSRCRFVKKGRHDRTDAMVHTADAVFGSQPWLRGGDTAAGYGAEQFFE
jgi:hypothetical protein